MALHIFWDNSNVWGGLNSIRQEREPDVPWYALRAYFKNIYKLVSKGRPVRTKIMAGSVPPECEELWECARQLGFNTDLLKRVDSSPTITVEQAVDEILHLKMANAILDYEPPQTMVILSGDSKDSDYGTSFPTQIKRALKSGWDVEIYAAKQTIGYKYYRTLLRDYPGKLTIIELDNYYESLTFVKAGNYHKKDASGDKIYFDVPARIVQPLK